MTQTRKEKRTAARRSQILDAAAKVFAEKGFQKSTTREIADAADVAEGTIYNYFENKDDLLIGLLDRVADVQSRSATLESTLDEAFEEGFIRITLERIGQVTERLETFSALLPEILITPALRERYYKKILQPLVTALEEHLQKRVARGEARLLDIALTTRFILSLTHGSVMLLMLGDPVLAQVWQDPNRLAEEMIRFCFEGINPSG
jgi:AcrR family transcriptional regulator